MKGLVISIGNSERVRGWGGLGSWGAGRSWGAGINQSVSVLVIGVNTLGVGEGAGDNLTQTVLKV